MSLCLRRVKCKSVLLLFKASSREVLKDMVAERNYSLHANVSGQFFTAVQFFN